MITFRISRARIFPRTLSLTQAHGVPGGARVVFLFAGEDIPVFLLTVFAKNEKADLSVAEREALIRAAKELAADYGRDP